MIDLENFETLREWTASAGELTEAAYAQSPFRLLARGAAPFDSWRRPGRAVPAELAPVWGEAVAGWQLCAFHAVNATTAGTAFAERILDLQRQFLDALRPGAGVRHVAAIRILYPIAWRPMEVETPGGGWVEVPTEWRAAVEFLLTSPRSPYCTEDWTFAPDRVPAFPDDLDVDLAQDLEQAWAAAADYFTHLLPALKTA